MEFFRFCPECGRRFHIKLVSKKRLRLDRVSIRTTRAYKMGGGGISAGISKTSIPPEPTVVVEGPPMIIDVEEFQYVYKCKHCGHEWSEKRIKKHKEE
jgi:DNA-directed RNA polymerase subunit M/transcription elongation factor TFIIS